MKKHLSVLGLFASSSLFKIMAVIVAMCAAEFIFFYLEFREAIGAYESVVEISRPEKMVENSGMFFCFGVAFIIITVILCLSGTNYTSKCEYTLKRLRVSESFVFLYKSVFNVIAYMIMWVAQAAVCFLAVKYYVASAPVDAIGSQTAFLAFYRSELLHATVPMADISVWVRNIVSVLTIGVCAAEFPYLERRKRFSVAVIAFGIYTILNWKIDLDSLIMTVFTIVIAIIVLSSVAYHVLGDTEEEDNET